MIGTSAFVGYGLMLAFGLVLPTAVAVWWIVTRKERVSTVLLGAATWFVFAIILESIPKAILFTAVTPIGEAVLSNTALATVLGALLAGVFEETGRYVVFKTLLKGRNNRETAIAHGIGHGGFEAMYLLALTGLQCLTYALLINSGQFDALVAETAAAGADVSALEALPAQLAAMTVGLSFVSLLERVFAVLLHIGLSILVFCAVKQSKPWLYGLSVLLHALFDVPAALYQFGVITNIYVVEALLGVYASVFFAVVYLKLYKGYLEPEPEISET